MGFIDFVPRSSILFFIWTNSLFIAIVVGLIMFWAEQEWMRWAILITSGILAVGCGILWVRKRATEAYEGVTEMGQQMGQQIQQEGQQMGQMQQEGTQYDMGTLMQGNNGVTYPQPTMQPTMQPQYPQPTMPQQY